MGRRMEFKLNTEDEKYLREIIKRGTTEARLYKRAMILLMKSEGKTYMDIARALKVSRNTVVLWVEKYKADENPCDFSSCLKADGLYI